MPDTRQKMIETAVRMFQEHGYHGVSWRKLVAEAKAPWGSISHHFPGGKKELAVAAVRAGAEAVDSLIRGCFDGEENAPKAIEKWFRATALHMQDQGFQTGCPVASIAQSTTPEVPEVAEASAAAFELWKRTLAALLTERGIARRRARRAAETAIVLLEGGIVHARISRSKAPLERIGGEAAAAIARELSG
ncbi:MAG: TetR/AcrR family transcriptional regulator [Proteobacteria bacterium]|nr:TetR/AcrR family transcriptional regulator [Pseudomonadota bacterium]